MKQPIKVTIDDMEASARDEANGCKNYRVKGKWLEVVCFAANGPNDEYFKYNYDNKPITKQQAWNLLEFGHF